MVETEPDPYNVLGLTNFASSREEISKAARKLGLKYHPDKNPSDEAADMFLRVQRAKDLLLDDTRRAAYDDIRNAALKRKVYEEQRTSGMDDKRKRFRKDLDERMAGAGARAGTGDRTKLPIPGQTSSSSSSATGGRGSNSSSSSSISSSASSMNAAELDRLRAEGQRLAEEQSETARQRQRQQSHIKAQAGAAVAAAHMNIATPAKITLRQVKIKWRRTGESQSEESLFRLMRSYGEVDSAVLTGTKGTSGMVTFATVSSAVAAVYAFATNEEFRVSRVEEDEEEDKSNTATGGSSRSSSSGRHTGGGIRSTADLKAVLSSSRLNPSYVNSTGPRVGEFTSSFGSGIGTDSTTMTSMDSEMLNEVKRVLERQRLVHSMQSQSKSQSLAHSMDSKNQGLEDGATADVNAKTIFFTVPHVTYEELVQAEQRILAKLDVKVDVVINE